MSIMVTGTLAHRLQLQRRTAQNTQPPAKSKMGAIGPQMRW